MSYTVIETAEKSVIMAIPIIVMGIVFLSFLAHQARILNEMNKEESVRLTDRWGYAISVKEEESK